MLHNLYERRVPLNGTLMVFLIALTTAALALVALDQTILAIGAGLGILLFLAILARPDFATLVVVFILYTNAAVIAVKFHNVPTLIGASLPALLVFPLASYVIIRREKIILNPILLPIFLFLAVQVVGTLFALDIALAVDNVQTFVLEGLGIYFLLTNVVRTPKQLRRVTWALLAAGAFIGGLSVYQQMTGSFDNDFGGFAQMSFAQFSTGVETINGAVTQGRLAGPIGEKNRYAQIMLMLVPLGMFRVFGEKKPLLRVLAGLATALSALGASLAFSRGAAVGFVLMLAIMVFMRYIKIWQVGIMLLGLYLLLLAVPTYATRLNSLQGLVGMFSEEDTAVANADGATLSRLTEMGAAGLVFLDHPVIGVGPGMFPLYYQDYAELIGLRTLNADRQAHDLYVSIAAETGLLGLTAFLALVYLTLRNLARVRKRWIDEEPELANMATAYMLAIVTYLTTGIFLHFSYIRYFWLIMALAGAVMHIAERHALRVARRGESDQALMPAGRESHPVQAARAI